ncbi:hypothetical protein [Aquimarina rhabdastrellae]
MPIVGVIMYFMISPRFTPETIIQTKILGLFIITVIIPIILYFLLKNLGFVSSIHLKTPNERKIPLLLQSLLLLFVTKLVVNLYDYPELYYFFLGALISSLSAVFITLFNIKPSLHMLGTGAITMFTIALSIHFNINLTLLIAFQMVANGMVATSRLHDKAHTNLELILGLLLGIIPQLTLLNFWL